MHLDAAKATQDVGEADFLRLVHLGLLVLCLFIAGPILLHDQDFMS